MHNPDVETVKYKVTPHNMHNPDVNVVEFLVTPLSLQEALVFR